jgi:hypothetical protein
MNPGYRQRQLASDTRAGSWTRDYVWRIRLDFLRRIWRLNLGLASIAVTFIAVVLLAVPGEFLRGLLVGAVLAAVPAVLGIVVMQATGTAQRSMGATAEQWTASELRRLQRHGSRVVNHLALDRVSDIDHVLIGPTGVIAVETKWFGDGWDGHTVTPRLTDAIDQLQRNARRLRLWELTRKLRSDAIPPVLFIWGYARDHHTRPVAPVTINGVTVVHGTPAANSWRAQMLADVESATATAEQIADTWNAVEVHITRRDAHDRAVNPPPPSLERMFWLGVAGIVLAITAARLDLQIGTRFGDHVWAVITALSIAVGVALRRTRRLRFAATACLAGMLLVVLAAVVVLVNRIVA